jgi:hypothetical protein
MWPFKKAKSNKTNVSTVDLALLDLLLHDHQESLHQ